MAKRIVLIVVAVVGVAAGWAGLRAQPAQERPLCYLKNATYSPGAMIKDEDQVYRCFYVFGENLNSRTPGVAWVKMVRQGDTFVPKEPSDGR
jgi:hypothetical protein